MGTAMPLIRDETVRSLVASELAAAKRYWPPVTAVTGLRLANLDDLDEIANFLHGRRRRSIRGARSQLSGQLSVCLVGVLALGMLALAVRRKGARRTPVPRDWLSPTRRPDPNLVLQNLLTQLSNHALATLYLVEAGLDNAARALLRVVHEAVWLTVAVAAEREVMIDYTRAAETEERSATWWRRFSPKRLNPVLLDTEKQLGLPEDLRAVLSRSRTEAYHYYSRAVHSSYVAVMVGAYAPSLRPNGWFHFGLWGASSTASEETLKTLNWMLWYAVSLVTRVFLDIHRFRPPRRSPEWRAAILLARCVQECFDEETRRRT